MSMRLRQFSIRTLLLFTIGALALLTTTLVAREVYTQWVRLDSISMLKEATKLSDELFDVTYKLSVERDVAYSMLYASDRKTIDDLRTTVESSRRDADASLSSAYGTLEQYRFPEVNEILRRNREQFTEFQALRRQVDTFMAASPATRDRVLPQRWFDQATTVIVHTQDIWMQFATHFTDIDPYVTLHMRFKHVLGIIMEYSGRERALIGKLLAENADPSPAEQLQLLEWRGAANLGWIIGETLARQSGLTPAITPAFKDARSYHQSVYDMMRDIFYQPGAHHTGSYPISAEFWLELATETNDSLYALKDAALAQSHAYVQGLERKAQHEIIVNFLILLFALTLCGYSFRLVSRRVIAPINAIVTALLDAMEGKTVSFALPARSQQNEIGKLAQVLEAFQRNTEKIRQNEKNNAHLAAIVESSDDAIISKTLDGTIVSWNPGAEHLLGYSSDEAVGRHINLIIPEERLEEEVGIIEKLGQNQRISHLETVRRHKNGRRIDISLTVSPIYDLAGNNVGASKIIRDITARKQADAQLLNYTKALERSNKELDDFAYIASHDLKEPLRGLHNHARFLLEDNQDKLDAESVSRLNRLTYLSQRMERLVNDLLYFSRLGRQELAIQTTDLNEVVRDIEDTLDVFLEERHGRITIPKPLPTITCDKTRVTELLRNLITNAMKYNDNAEKIVEIGFLEEQPVTGAGMMKDVFYVKDNGRGIEEGFYDEIFRIFKRLQSNKDSLTEGTGVGLTFVKKIVERHGGRIWLASEPGKGTIFYFTLKGELYDSKASA